MSNIFKLDIKINTSDITRQMDKLTRDEIPRAISVSLNRIAGAAKRAIVSKMDEAFENPVPYTLGAFRIENATPENLTVAIATKNDRKDGEYITRSAYDYIKTEVTGGQREMKRSEIALKEISGGQYWLPGKDAPLDQHGNVKKSEIIRLLSRLGAMRNVGLNMSDKTARRLARKGMVARGQRSEYFVARDKGNGRPKGIYKYVSPGKVDQILIFTSKTPTYKSRLPVEKTVQETVDRLADRLVKQSVEGALKKRLGG
ncbi:hypothetical protein [Kozakia baliensis]|uniref:hypothetical protein n=1 Tax=Kozakia baliensis TaxID=153496 RepID=UPI0004962F74|nr:hypothetical protein [Kozakia baliensis]